MAIDGRRALVAADRSKLSEIAPPRWRGAWREPDGDTLRQLQRSDDMYKNWDQAAAKTTN